MQKTRCCKNTLFLWWVCKYISGKNACVKNGAVLKHCSVDECTNAFVKNNVCMKHGAFDIDPFLACTFPMCDYKTKVKFSNTNTFHWTDIKNKLCQLRLRLCTLNLELLSTFSTLVVLTYTGSCLLPTSVVSIYSKSGALPTLVAPIFTGSGTFGNFGCTCLG